VHALDRRFGHHHEVHALGDVKRIAIEPVEERRAHRAGMLRRRPIHEAIDHEGILPRNEQLRELRATLHGSVPLLELVVLRHATAAREATAQPGDRLHPLAQIHLRLQELVPRLAVFRAFSREANAVQ